MMYKMLRVLVLCLPVLSLKAQAPTTAGEYMAYLSDREKALSERYLVYMSESAHGNRARKLEKKRQELITEIRKSLSDANRLKPFKGDATLRDAYKRYWDILLKVFNEDYAQIVNLEEIAEQSYDKMEAYLAAQERAGDVLDAAHDSIEPVFKNFALNNNITIIENETRMSKKLAVVGKVNGYYHQIFLIYFKSLKQEMYVIDAFNRKDIAAVEQNRTTLIKFAAEGLTRLDTIKRFNDDGSLIEACRKVLAFHKAEAENEIPTQAQYLVKSNEFEKIRKAFEAKPATKRTQADIDAYNKAVNEVNAVMTTSNKSLESTNKGRDKVLKNWDITANKFMETYVPRSR